MSLHDQMLGLFQLKFGWVYEAPYTVWSIVDSASAAAFLAAHDAQAEAGTSVHRVTHFVAGKEPWTLRRDLQRLAVTGHWTQRLWAELQAYRMCPLDETAIEAVHRDVTHLGKLPPLLDWSRTLLRTILLGLPTSTLSGRLTSALRPLFDLRRDIDLWECIRPVFAEQPSSHTAVGHPSTRTGVSSRTA